jgi:elongation factor Ts
MSFRRFKRFDAGSKLCPIFIPHRQAEFEGDETAAKDVAMHVAAMAGLAQCRCPDLVARERSVKGCQGR